MGSAHCCTSAEAQEALTAQGEQLKSLEAVPVVDDGQPAAGLPVLAQPSVAVKPFEDYCFRVTLKKEGGMKLGLDVDFMIDRRVLPVMSVTGGSVEEWNKKCPAEQRLTRGDGIIEANGVRDDVAGMLEMCKVKEVIELVAVRGLNQESLAEDLENLIRDKGCGPILMRLSWHDAGVFSTGGAAGGCPNAAMRLKDSSEAAFDLSRGLPTFALSLLAPIATKYCPYLLSHADLWAFAANTAIRVMGGPEIPTKFGRLDAKTNSECVSSQADRLPDPAGGADHLRSIFGAKGFDDKAIVALSGAHTVGTCHPEWSGFDGAWTDNPLRFDNSYFAALLNRTWTPETTAKGQGQFRHAQSGTTMMPSDLALIQDPGFKMHVERYARDQAAFFCDFVEAWSKAQELGCSGLRDIL